MASLIALQAEAADLRRLQLSAPLRSVHDHAATLARQIALQAQAIADRTIPPDSERLQATR